MNFKDTIARLRAAGVPDAAIPAVMEMLDEREAEARRPRTGTERSRTCRERQRNENATKTLHDRSEDVASPLHDRCADVAPTLPPRERAVFTGEELDISLEASASKGADAPTTPTAKPITPDQDLFKRAREVFGENCGGQIAKLKALYGGDVEKTRITVEQAALTDQPTKYLAAIIFRSGPQNNFSRAGPDARPATRNGKPSVSDFARAQDERLNGNYGDDRRGDAGEVRQVSGGFLPRW